MPPPVLSAAEIEQFVRDGAVPVRGAFSRETAEQCRELLWAATGCDERDRSTWIEPVIRIGGRADPPFAAAANTVRLRAALDQLAGVGRWIPRDGLGTFPIRFPVPTPPDDDGWHIESTGTDDAGTMIVDPRSPERVLLMLFLFSDVGPADAPTRLRLGSHLVAARCLFTRDAPADFFGIARELARRTEQLPEAAATGSAGDVWLCHPFLVHAAQRHRGSRVKFMAQPPLRGTGPIDPSRPAEARSPVDEAVRRALAG